MCCALGSDVTLFCRGETALRRFDPILATTLDAEMKAAGITVSNNSNLTRVTKCDDGTMTIALRDVEDALPGFNTVLFAIGRAPSTSTLGLEAAGVETTDDGFVPVDDYQMTSAEGVYAVGDIMAGGIELTPVAIAAGRKLADRLFAGREGAKVSYDCVPSVIFSHPPIATCGVTEPEAREQYGDDAVTVYTSRFGAMLYAVMPTEGVHKPKTAMKVVCAGEDQRVVGLHIIGVGADEMMQGFGVAMRMGCTKGDLDNCIAIHPTSSEEVVTMAPWGELPPSRM